MLGFYAAAIGTFGVILRGEVDGALIFTWCLFITCVLVMHTFDKWTRR